MKLRCSNRFALLLTLCAATACANAASLTWDSNGTTTPNPNGGSGTWNVNSNLNWWNGTTNVVWPALGGTDDDAVFAISGATVTLGTDITANDLTFNVGCSLVGTQTLTLNGTTPTITASGATTNIGNASANIVIAGSAGLTKTGAAGLTLNGKSVHTFTGGVAVNGGTLSLSLNALTLPTPPTDLINSANALSLAGGIFSVSGKSSVVASQTLNGLTINQGSSSMTATAGSTGGSLNLILGAISRSAGGTINFTLPTSGAISTTASNNITTGILGPWASTGSSTSTKYVTVSSGNIAALTGTTAATGAGLTDTTGAVNYDLNAGGGTVPGTVSANTIRYTPGAGTTAPGATSFKVNGLMNAGSATWTIGSANKLTIGTDNELVVNTANSPITVSSIIQDGAAAASLTKTGNNTLNYTLTLSGVNTYTGGTLLSAGTLTMGNAAALGTGSLTIMHGTTLDSSVANLVNSQNNTQTWNGDFTFAGTQNLNLGTGTISLGTASGTARTVTITTKTLTAGGVISNGTTATGLTKAGSGTLTLSGTNSYTGTTTVSAGQLNVTGTGTLGATTAGLTMSGGVLDLGTTSQTLGAVSVTAASTIQNGSLAGTSYAVSNASGTATISANLLANGAAGLSKSGAGTLILSGANTYTGATTISAGTLQFAKQASLYNSTTGSWTKDNVIVMNGATVVLNVGDSASGFFDATALSTLQTNLLGSNTAAQGFQAGSIIGLDTTNATGATFTQGNAITNPSGAGGGAVNLTKLGTGTLVLDQPNTYTGTTAIAAGTLALSGGSNRLASTGSVNFTGTGTTLDLSAATSQTLASITVGKSAPAAVATTLTGATTATSLALANMVVGDISGTTAPTASLTLLGTNIITATTAVGVGDMTLSVLSSSTSARSGTLNLGQSTTLNATSINVGKNFTTTGTVQFAAALNATSLTIRGTAGGITRADMVIGSQASAGNSTAITGMVDLTNASGTNGSTLDAMIGTLTIGQNTRTGGAGTGSSSATGTFKMGGGTMDATTIIVGQDTLNGGGNATGASTSGTFTTGTGTVKAVTLTMGDRLSTNANTPLNATLNLDNGGILQATTIKDGTNADTNLTRTFNWTNGTIQNISGGNLAVNSTATGAQALTLKLADTGTHAFDIEAGRNGSVSAQLIDATTGGTLTKKGSGTLTLSAANSYSGTTTVNAGTLLANNATGSATGTNTITVKDTATFGGTGAVSGAVTLESGGTLAPGASIESLATGALTLPAGATLAAEINSSGTPTADSLAVTGDLTLGGALTVTDIAGTPAAITLGTKLTLITYTGALTQTFTGKAEGSTFAVGANTFKIRYADGGKNVTLEAVSAAGYGSWSSTNAPSGTAAQDFDNDGISNGAEWVLGGLATANDAAKLPTVSTLDGNLVFTFLRNQASKTADTAVSIQVGTDLATWPSTYIVGNTTATSTTGVTVTDNGNGTDTVKLTVAQAPDAKKFARLDVMITP